MKKIYEMDPYLEPFEEAIEARHKRIMDARDQFSVDGSLSEGLNNHLYYGLHRTDDGGWVFRGADIVKLNDLPTRYIKDSNTSKLLSVWDIVIEVSGGSPTQATGRSAFVTPGVLKRNGGNLTCSNFCHAFTMKNYKASAYFFFMWRMFYDNNNMFNYEGKTSEIGRAHV